MKRNHCAFWGFVLAAALLLAGCGRADSGSTSGSSSAGSSAGASQTAAWKTGLGVLTEASDSAAPARSIPLRPQSCWTVRGSSWT